MSFAAQVLTGDDALSPIGSTLYGTCGTGANAPIKVVSLSAFDALLPGVTIHVKFLYSNMADNPKLDINNSGNDIPIYAYGTMPPGKTEATSWKANSVVSFTYDDTQNGECWRMNDAGANSAMISLLEGEVTAEATARENGDTAVLAVIAPDYDSTALYRKNQLCVYGGKVYRCKDDITTAEEWTAGHWDLTTVAAEREYKLTFSDVVAGVAPTASATVSGTGVTAATVDANTFSIIIQESGTYEFIFSGADWSLNGNLVTLGTYGITPTGTPVTGDTITVTYTVGTAPFVANATYSDYPYRAAVSLANVRSTMVPFVTFAVADAISGIFAPVSETYDGGIYLYATEVPGDSITLPTIVCLG